MQHEILKFHSQDLSRLQSDPEASDALLDQLAQEISLDALGAALRDSSVEMDLRFLAAELIARINKTDKIPLVLEMLGHTRRGPSSDIRHSEDFAIQARLLEGLGNLSDKATAVQTLDRIIENSEDILIVDRAQRTRTWLLGRAPSPVEQDQEALRKILRH
ncbi:MAG: hypothetical protein N2578_03295 [Bdellovibrionaceae bacterium]|nr:hypothetical protein [Pseudobdellovibrionaceae bacterium]